MMLAPSYNPQEIEPKWQQFWDDNATNATGTDAGKPKYYVLDMFPYPSGAGLHVGHPLGYIASDIVARYKRLRGYNVLHPMGFDAFGLPAEQYAIQTGQHPAKTTEDNIARYIHQLKSIGLSYDWAREVRTSDPDYYKWTQWIFIRLFHHWYDKAAGKARPIEALTAHLAAKGSAGLQAAADEDTPAITAEAWNALSEGAKEDYLQHYRLAFTSEAYVNWCPALGTVLANDEVKDGFSERGGYPVERKLMRQFMLRITAYADRLLDGLDTIDWSESIKEQQRNWIGRSAGAEVVWETMADGRWQMAEKAGHAQTSANGHLPSANQITVFTTRPDTLYGATFLVLAPEHPLVPTLTTEAQQPEVEAYIEATARRSELDRKADVKRVSGAFTGSYAAHPITGAPLPVWIADYVLAGYGTGAIMAVPSSDTRDHAFATHFNLPIVQVQEGPGTDITAPDFDPKAGTMINSGAWNGLSVPEAITAAIAELERLGAGTGRTQYRMRDAVFGRQRYWGEPIPVYYENGIPRTLPDSELPLVLPDIDKFLPTETGEPPLARAADWHYNGHPLETTTMPGWAGSSWYFLRYMDPENTNSLGAQEELEYWGQVDLYLGGSEHATGHLLYARFWNKFLYDLGIVKHEEPFKKLVNQGMIMGVSEFISHGWIRYLPYSEAMFDGTEEEYNNHRLETSGTLHRFNFFKSYDLIKKNGEVDGNHERVPIHLVKDNVLNIEKYIQEYPEYYKAPFDTEGGEWREGVFNRKREGSDKFFTWSEVEKMSKSKLNVVNPDDIITKYGADTLRLYEMFLGPLEQSKPWNTAGIEGVAKFLRKYYRLFVSDNGEWLVTNDAPTRAELGILHKLLRKVEEDMEALSFNTTVSALMIACNGLTDVGCHKRAILEPLTVALSPLAPHLAEELWAALGHATSVTKAAFTPADPQYLVSDTVLYPISINGKKRHELTLPASATPAEVEAAALADETVQRHLGGIAPKKVIVVPGRIVNIVA